MNNTSAYANVLLKTPVATAIVAASKRDYQDDYSSIGFHQTLKDVNDNQRSQDNKRHTSAHPKKSTPVEHHRDAKHTNVIKNVKAANDTAAKQKSADDSAHINQNAIGGEVVAEQPIQHHHKEICTDKSTDGESAKEVTNLVADKNLETTEDTGVIATDVNGMGVGVIQSSLISDAELAVESMSTQEIVVAIDQATSLPLVKPVTDASVAANTITLETENLATVLPSTDASLTVEKSEAVASQPLVVDELLLKQNLTQPLADSSQAITVNQPTNPVMPADVQALAAGVMASSTTKPLQPHLVLTEMSEVSDEVIDLLTPLVTDASASTKLTHANNHVPTNNTVNPDVTTAQAQMNASKTAFEKTLQAIVSPDASGADDIVAPALNSTSTTGATNSLMDSLMRGADQQSPAARSFVVQTAVPVPVGQPQWSQAVGEKVLWLAAQNVSSADINLHPKDLGPLQVRVSVNQEQTTVSFTSQHAVVREVLDQHLNRLRDMFSEQGLNLVNVDISDKSFSRQQGDTQAQKGQGSSHDVTSEEETAVAMSAIVQQRLVDHYA